MTPAELHEIVKDVPREWWPKRCAYITVYGWDLQKLSPNDSPRSLTGGEAADLFIASMLRGLTDKPLNDGFEIEVRSEGTPVALWTVHLGPKHEASAPTLIEALAQACNATKE